MPFRSLTDSEYEEIFKAAIGKIVTHKVDNTYIGDICKTLSLGRTATPEYGQNVEDKVVTPNENEAYRPTAHETADQPPVTELDTELRNGSSKPSKVKLFTPEETLGQKKIIPVFTSKTKTQLKSKTLSAKTSSPAEVQKKSSKICTNTDTSSQKGQAAKGKQGNRRVQTHSLKRKNTDKESSKVNANIDSLPQELAAEQKQENKAEPQPGLKGKNVNKGPEIAVLAATHKNTPSTTVDMKSSETGVTINQPKKQRSISSKVATKSVKKSDEATSKNLEHVTTTPKLSADSQRKRKNGSFTSSKTELKKKNYSKASACSKSTADSEGSQLVPSQQDIPLSQPPPESNLQQRLKWLQDTC